MEQEIVFEDTRLILLPQKALLMPQYQLLLLADWHLGKAAHFRKEGIFMPLPEINRELDRLQVLLDTYGLRRVVFLGDLFHSLWNSEWIAFCNFMARNGNVQFILTKGNHDILPLPAYREAGMTVLDNFIAGTGILCTHHPMEIVPPGILNIAGHIHPGCILKTMGRQFYRLPCFYYYDSVLLLPAFGNWTGLHIPRVQKGAKIYPVLEDRVVAWKE